MTTTTSLGYPLVDADHHFYDQPDAFTRYIPDKYRNSVVREVIADGEWSLFAGDRRVTFVDSARSGEGNVLRPGSLKDFMHSLKSGAGKADYTWESLQPEYLSREPRLKVMDAQGVEAILIFPSEASTVEGYIEDPDALYANLHAYNRYYNDEWGFNYRDRIFAPPMISMRDVDRAVEEVEWALGLGARVFLMRPGPVDGRSPADQHFDPVWARLNEAGAAVAYHITETGYNQSVSVLWGEESDPPVHYQSAWQFSHTYGDRPIMETLSALIFGNLFGRFPRSPGGQRRARLRMGALPSSPDGQDAGHGTKRAMAGRPPNGAAQRDLQTTRTRHALCRRRCT